MPEVLALSQSDGLKLSDVWKQSLELWARVFKRTWAWLLFAQTIEVLTSLGASALERYQESYLIVGVVFMFLVTLFLNLIGFIIVNQITDDVVSGRRESKITASLDENLRYVFIEYSRQLVRVLLYLLLFVIPGLVVWVRLNFAPYVALLDPEYKKGRIDALERSRDMVNGRFWKVGGILISAYLLSIVPSVWLGTVKLFEKPFAFSMLFFASMVSELYSGIVVYCAYKRLGEQHGDSIPRTGTSPT